ncbi:hypothetical protein [Halosimplex halobium]|uniref:hypothetical protein n=1 Tax=Halosimplex halobium TaxID=3396618 RepID=UPI003F559CA1
MGGGAATGAFTGGDQAIDGVFLDPANTSNGDAYAEINDQGQLRIELTNLNAQATTTVDDVFTISSTNHRSRVWIEHDAGSDVTFYRSDTDTSIGGSGDRVVLGENETVPVGLRIDAGSESVVLTQITVHAEIRPTATASPTTVAAGPGQSTPSPTPVPTAPPTTTATPTTEQPTTTAAPTTAGPTSTDGGSTSTDDGSTPTDDGGSTPDGTAAPPETTVPPTTAPPTTAPPTTSPPPTTAPATTAPPDDESPTPTASTPTTEPDEGSPTATAPPVTTAPPEETPGTTADPGVTVSTPDDGDTEIGGLSPVQLGGVVAALAALALGLFAWGLLGSSSSLVLVADAGEGLEVRPQSLTADWYDTREDGFAFRFAESDPWVEATGDGPVTFEGAATVTNTGSGAARVTVADAESLPGVGLSAEGVDLTGDGLVLDAGESADLTLELPADFDPDGEVTVRLRRTPLD